MKKGLNGFQIKVIALILMTFDHIYYMLGLLLPIPKWFTMIGRVSAPLFFFMVANGMRHTSNRKKYMLRLYIGSVIMGAGNAFFGRYFPNPSGAVLMANIFSTLFIICLLIYAGENLGKAIKEKKPAQALWNALLLSLPFVFSILLISVLRLPGDLGMYGIQFGLIFLPSALFTEGGIPFVLMGIGMYLFADKKKSLAIFYTLFCVFIAVSNYSPALGWAESLRQYFQWLMIGSLPIMLMYNDERGPSMKYFFYAYYPIHLYTLLFVARFVGKQQGLL